MTNPIPAAPAAFCGTYLPHRLHALPARSTAAHATSRHPTAAHILHRTPTNPSARPPPPHGPPRTAATSPPRPSPPPPRVPRRSVRMTPPARDPYVVLGASCADSAGEIRRLYRRKSLESHPDKGGDAARFGEVSEAYKLLSDPRRRKQYDRSGFRSASDESACGFDADGGEEEDAMTPGEVFAMCFYLFLLAVYIFAGITGAFIVAGKPVFLERVQAFATAHAIMSGLAVLTWLVHKPFGETFEGETWLPAWLARSPSMQVFVAEWFGVTAGVLAIGVLWGLGAAFRFMLLHAVGQPWSRDSQYVCLMIPFLGEPLLCTRK